MTVSHQGEATSAGSARRSRWRDPKVLALVAVLVVVLVAVAVVLWGRRDSGEEDLRRDAGFGTLDDEQAEATRAYLSGDGAALLDLAAFADRIAALTVDDANADDECTDLAADWRSLADSYGGDDGLAGLIGPLPDPTLGQLWATQSVVVAEAMGLCEQGYGLMLLDGTIGQVAELQEAVDLRLADVGVER